MVVPGTHMMVLLLVPTIERQQQQKHFLNHPNSHFLLPSRATHHARAGLSFVWFWLFVTFLVVFVLFLRHHATCGVLLVVVEWCRHVPYTHSVCVFCQL